MYTTSIVSGLDILFLVDFLPFSAGETTFVTSCTPKKYHIRPNYYTYPYKRIVKQFGSHQITASRLCTFLYRYNGRYSKFRIRSNYHTVR